MNKNSRLAINIILFLSVFWSCTSCNLDNPKTDSDNTSDNDSNDIDSIKPDIDLNDDAVDIDVAVDEEINDDVEFADVDYQGAEDCPDLVKAKFPYYNNDKSIHFCRKCDKPTVKDPQCVENLWKDAAAALYAVSPESECKDGYPCDMPMIIPLTLEDWIAYEDKMGHKFPYRPHECDILLSAYSPHGTWATDSTAGAIKHFDISDGKVGLFLNNVNLDYKKYRTYAKTTEYDPATQKYRALSPIVQEMGAYNNGCMLHLVNNFHYYETVNNTTRYLAYSCTDGTRNVVYSHPIRFVSYTPGINDKWVIVNIQEEDGAPDCTMYAKIGEWKWTKLMEGLSYQPEIVNDKAIFYADSFKGYYCDLSKNPKSVDECIVVNENENEGIRYPLINEDDETEIIYEAHNVETSSGFEVKRLKIEKDGTKKYSKFIETHLSTDEKWSSSGYPLQRVTKDIIFYNEALIESEGARDGNACFYNRKTSKAVCMKKVEGMEKYYFGYGEWEGKWMVYQFRAVALQAVRDLDCYCEKEGVCPFEE